MFLRRSPILSYFLMAFLISWSGALAIAAPQLLRGERLSRLTGILMFPVMLIGPVACGVLLTRMVDGRPGLARLYSRLRCWRVAAGWYAILAIPPLAILAALLCLSALVSSRFAPNHFALGIAFGIPAGFLEEIGWMGYAYPKMRLLFHPLSAAVLLGVLWAAWHLPVVDFLGAAAPHGAYWFRFFLSFALVLSAIRVLICWVFINTESLFLAQLMHVSSTSSLVAFGAPQVTSSQEAFWYAVYGGCLWLVVSVVIFACGPTLQGNFRRPVSLGHERIKKII
jgi:membrane protease YdiL (CAAX protease family)